MPAATAQTLGSTVRASPHHLSAPRAATAVTSPALAQVWVGRRRAVSARPSIPAATVALPLVATRRPVAGVVARLDLTGPAAMAATRQRTRSRIMAVAGVAVLVADLPRPA